MPKLTASDALGGMLSATLGGIAVFCAGAGGVIAVSSFAANASKQYIGEKATKAVLTRREELESELKQIREQETSWTSRRKKENSIKRELKKLVDDM